MHDIQIRPAQLEELPTLYQFEQGIIAAERPFDPTLKPDPINYYDLKALILSPEAEVVVAVDNQKLVGSGYAQLREGKAYHRHDLFAYIGFMFVEQDYRGRRIAGLVIKHLAQWSKDRGVNEVRLEVYDENLAAVSAYQKMGFKKNLTEMRLNN